MSNSARADGSQRSWAHVHTELRRLGATLALLWQEYRLAHLQGFQHSRFCEHYRLWAAKVDLVMRHKHRAGEKLFVDYADRTGHWSTNQRDPSGADFRRRSRRVQRHLRRGHMVAETTRLTGWAPACAALTADPGTGRSVQRRHQGASLQARR